MYQFLTRISQYVNTNFTLVSVASDSFGLVGFLVAPRSASLIGGPVAGDTHLERRYQWLREYLGRAGGLLAHAPPHYRPGRRL